MFLDKVLFYKKKLREAWRLDGNFIAQPSQSFAEFFLQM